MVSVLNILDIHFLISQDAAAGQLLRTFLLIHLNGVGFHFSSDGKMSGTKRTREI
jgi:hypothetical protein